MTLSDLINALKTKNVKVTVLDAETDGIIITFFSEGIAGVEGDVSARTVRKWSLDGASSISVSLEAAN